MAAATAAGQRFDSWKDIAKYLGRDVRTVQRWETEKGLPVHRLAGAKHSKVYAFQDEIDGWLASQPTRQAGTEADGTPKTQNRRRTVLTIAAAAALILLLTAGSYIHARGKRVQAISARLHGNVLAAFDVSGKKLWEHVFPGANTTFGPGDPRQPAFLVQVADVNGDGRREVVAAIHNGTGTAVTSSEIDCFSSSGKMLWHDPMNLRIKGGEESYRPPWSVYQVLVWNDGNGPAVWAVLTHELWWPSMVVRIDGETGKEQIVYVNGGWLYSLAPSEYEGKKVLLAGGYNNEYKSSVLAVLNPKVEATSPQERKRFECTSCGTGRPLKYFVFPRSEVVKALAPDINYIFQISRDGRMDHAIDIQSSEGYGATGGRCCTALYRFRTNSMSPISFAYDDGYWQEHRELQREHLLHHDEQECPARENGITIRKWTEAAGWTDEHIGYDTTQ